MTQPTDPEQPIVYIVDDDDDLRGALRYLVESIGCVVRDFKSAQIFLAEYDGHRPACLITDIRMPEISGLELQDRLNKAGHDLPVIVLTGFSDVPSAVRALKSGAIDFIEKPFNDAALIDGIQKALADDVQRHTAKKQLDHAVETFAELTPREHEVMSLMVTGQSNKEIARNLDISVKTVEVHRSRVMQKTESKNIVDLLQLSQMCSQR